MQKELLPEDLDALNFLVGNVNRIRKVQRVVPRRPFDEIIVSFLNDLSGKLMRDRRVKKYGDLVTFAFWIRKASMNRLKDRFIKTDELRIGRGIVFHIAPSNVAVNFAYSLVSGLITGNVNVVRVPSRYFKQVDILSETINELLEGYEELKDYIFLLKYGKERKINDLLSAIADVRVIWGGDATISELRLSRMQPRSIDITFADRYSIAVIDAKTYLLNDNKDDIAREFYNDTFLTDQNACTSPRIVIWIRDYNDEAKNLFWQREHSLIVGKYDLQPIVVVNKLTNIYRVAAKIDGCRCVKSEDNFIVRLRVAQLSQLLMDYREHSGFFYEYDCDDIMQIRSICDDKRCQTVGYIGDKSMFRPIFDAGIKGVDRIVPIGRTMDFDLIWDGYDLVSQMTRVVSFL